MIKLLNNKLIWIIGYLILGIFFFFLFCKTGFAQNEEVNLIIEIGSSNPDILYLQEIVSKAPEILNNLIIKENHFIVETENVRNIPNIIEVLMVLFGAPTEIIISITKVGCHLTYVVTAIY